MKKQNSTEPKSTLSLRDALLSARDMLKREEVTIPELGITLWICELTSAQLSAYAKSVTSADGKSINATNAPAKLLVHALQDENGNRLYDQPGDVDRLAALPSSIINPLFKIAQHLSGLGEGNDKAKNSGNGQIEDSLSI